MAAPEQKEDRFTLPALPWAKDALSKKGISQETIEYHYGKHHAGYVRKLNAQDKAGNVAGGKSLEDLIRTADGKIFNLAAQIYNHTFYWNSMAAEGGECADNLTVAAKLKEDFGDIEFDNSKLTVAIAESLPELQKEAFVFSLTGETQKLIEKKEEQLSKRFKWLTMASAAAGVIGGLLPGGAAATHLGVDIPILLHEMYFQKEQLGIDEDSLRDKAESCGLCKTAFLDQIKQHRVNSTNPYTETDDPVWGNISEICNKLSFEMKKSFQKSIFDLMHSDKVAAKATFTGAITAATMSLQSIESASFAIPILGGLVSGTVSGVTTYFILNNMLSVHKSSAKGCINVIKSMAKKALDKEGLLVSK